MISRRALGAGTALALVGLVGLQAPALAAQGSPGDGDPYFPRQGNGGYQVEHYGLYVRYDPQTRHLRGTTRIRATSTQRLSTFDLDLRRSMKVRSVRVDGEKASFSQPRRLGQELVVRPRNRLARGADFTVVVRYAGRPRPVVDADGSISGWIPTRDGAFVVGEPQGSPGWFPGNDTPRDKATYDVRVRVPRGLTGVSNGDLVRRTRTGRWTTFQWHNGDPTATYLVTATVGRFRVSTGTTPGGVPYYNAIAPKLAAESKAVVDKLPAVTDYLAGLYGPYPFTSTGVVVDDAPRVGYALETQGRASYDRPPDELTLVHEAAHMYFGNSVTLKRWRDIWLAEGFAEFSSWMWSEHTGAKTAQQFFAESYRTKPRNPIWRPPPARPRGPANLFADSIYVRGAMTLQALRVKLGDEAFFDLLRSWHTAHRHGNATIKGFRGFAEARTGVELSNFFDVWLVKKAKPRSW